MEETNTNKEIVNKLSNQGYSKAAIKSIKQWYVPAKKPKK
jgi:hypothetical protein